MKVSKNNQQDEYRAFLKNIREERNETSNFAKLLFTIVLAILCAVIVCVTIFENSFLLSKIENNTDKTFFKKNRSNFEVPFSPKRQNILLLGVDSNGDGTDMWKGTRSDTIIVVNIDPRTHSIKAISIPRDSKVYLPDNNGVQKINSAQNLSDLFVNDKSEF